MFSADLIVFFFIIGWVIIITFKNRFAVIYLFRISLFRLLNKSPCCKRIDILDILRVIATFWIIAHHFGNQGRIDILERKPSAITFKNTIRNNIIFGPLLGNSTLSVEIFFVLSGLLSARSWNRNRIHIFSFGKQCVIFFVRRYLRIIPPVVIYFLLVSNTIMDKVVPR